MSGHNQTFYKLKAKQFKNKEEVLEWADNQIQNQEKEEHKLRERICWLEEQESSRGIDMVGTINNQIQMIGNLQQKIFKLEEQLDAQEARNNRIIDLLTEKQLDELKKMDEDEEEDEETEDE